MPAMHALFHKLFRRFRDASTYASKGPYANDSKGSYLRHHSSGRQRQNSIPLGAIKKSTDVNIFRTERSSSDVELVTQLPRT